MDLPVELEGISSSGSGPERTHGPPARQLERPGHRGPGGPPLEPWPTCQLPFTSGTT